MKPNAVPNRDFRFVRALGVLPAYAITHLGEPTSKTLTWNEFGRACLATAPVDTVCIGLSTHAALRFYTEDGVDYVGFAGDDEYAYVLKLVVREGGSISTTTWRNMPALAETRIPFAEFFAA